LAGVLVILQRSLIREIRIELREAVAVNCCVRKAGEGADAWDTWTVARPGDELEFLVKFENASDRTLRNVVVGNNLPKYMAYVGGSTELRNGAFPSGTPIRSDNIVHGGINVGNYHPGAVGYARFTALVDPIAVYEKGGTYDLRNVGIVRPEGLTEHYNVAKVLLDVQADGVAS
jgi:uncharacterized repeat protein (TIGR01451 family)